MTHAQYQEEPWEAVQWMLRLDDLYRQRGGGDVSG